MVPIQPRPPAPAPEIRYYDGAGIPLTLEPGKAPLTMLHFWSTWCVPCIAELPQVDAISETYKNKGLRVIAISMDGKRSDKVKAFFAQHGIKHLPPYLDTDVTAFHALKLRGLPTSVFLNEKGEEIARAEGPVDWTSKAAAEFIVQQLP